jgi:hypothetical protein
MLLGIQCHPLHSRHPLLSIELEVSQNASLNFLSTHKVAAPDRIKAIC